MFDPKKLSFFLPNIFTALNMACGYGAIISSIHGKFDQACLLLFLGAIFDSVDGRVARLTGTESAFGEQFDSMSDLISFGVAPAILFYYRFLFDFGRHGIAVTFIFILCGALRLARFNANINSANPNYFQGLPIPGACLALIGYVLIAGKIDFFDKHEWISFVYILFYSIVMISNIGFYSFKKAEWLKRHRKSTLFIIFLLFLILYIGYEHTFFAIMNLYVIVSLVYFIIHKGKIENVFEWNSEND